MSILHLTEESFEKAVEQAPVMLVDFWAVWCGPCKMVAPELEKVAEELAEQVVVAKVDVDDAPNLAQKMGILSIPTMAIFKNGKEVDRMVGYNNSASIIAALQRHL